MSELTFGEKLLIARKQLDLYQYEMAERLGVHPNSIWKYERGEGKPHSAVVRMLDLLCEKHNIDFSEYESGSAKADKGDVMKIVLAEKVSPATLAVFAAEPGWEVLTHDQLPDGLPAALADADALVVRSAVQVDDALMEHAPKLRVVGRAGVGVDNIDADAATRRGVVVMNTPGANAVAVAELTIGLMLAMARKLTSANATMHAGKWEKKSLQGAELRGKTLGILGLGRVGLEVAKRAKGFGLEIIGQRSVCFGCGGPRERHQAGNAGRDDGRVGLHYAACGADGADRGRDQREIDRDDEERCAHHQLRARRAD